MKVVIHFNFYVFCVVDNNTSNNGMKSNLSSFQKEDSLRFDSSQQKSTDNNNLLLDEEDRNELRQLIRTLRQQKQSQHKSPHVIIEEETELLALISLYLKEKSKQSSTSSGMSNSALSPTSSPIKSPSHNIYNMTKELKVKVLSKLLEQDFAGAATGTSSKDGADYDAHLLEEMLQFVQDLPTHPISKRTLNKG